MSSRDFGAALRARREAVQGTQTFEVCGKLKRVVGLTLEAEGCEAALGDRCWLLDDHGRRREAEVVGFAGDSLFLMPIEDLSGLSPNARVLPGGKALDAPAGRALLGRVVDGVGEPLDGRGPLRAESTTPLAGRGLARSAATIIVPGSALKLDRTITGTPNFLANSIDRECITPAPRLASSSISS